MIVLITHLGAGDAILQAGLVVALSKRHGPVAFPCYPFYLESVRSFFVHYPEIQVYEVQHRPGFDWGSPPDSEYIRAIEAAGIPPHAERVRLGVYAGKGLWTDFSRTFYDGVKIGYEERFDSCPIKKASELVPQLEWADPGAENAFLHDDRERGFHITRIEERPFYRPVMQQEESILQYVNLLETAAHIDCIDSAFLHLCNSITLTGKAQLHCYARWPRPRDFRYVSKNQWDYLF